MAKPSKEERWAAVHEQAMRAFNCTYPVAMEEREQCREDRRFGLIAGAQWEGDLLAQFENKPRFEINKVRRSVDRITDEHRNNRIGVTFESKDGTPDDKLADTCTALHRSDEQDSTAEEAYDLAFDEAVSGGIGAWRLRARYADEDDEDGEDDADEARPQRIRFDVIPDADISVFFDANSKRQDKSDARFCFVLTSMTRDAYKEEYDDDPASWPAPDTKQGFDWSPPDAVILAEWYRVEKRVDTIRVFQSLDGENVEHPDTDFEDDEDLERTLLATGHQEIDPRKTKRRRVVKYLLNGQRVLDECRIAGRQIPVIMTFGKRAFIDGKERCAGHVRLAKDAQRILNMVLSKLAEICGTSVSDKPIVTPEQIAGHEGMWNKANIANWPYLLLNPITDPSGQQVASGPIGFTKPPSVPPTLAALAEIVESALKDILGNPQEAEKMVSHVAGKTVEILQQVLDKHAFIYISNMAKAIRRSGQVWLSMAREIYREAGRKMKGINRLSQPTQIVLMKPVIGPDGTPTYEADMSRANLDVNVNVGPSSATKRQATVQTAIAMMPVTDDPETKAVWSSIAMANMEGEGLEGPRQFARLKLVRLGVEKPTPEEAKQLAAEEQSRQPTPADQYALSAAREADARAQQALQDSALKAAQTDKSKADTIKVLADVDLAKRQAAVDAVESLHGMISTPAPLPGQPPGLGSSQ
jgi:hypothetical protein